MPAPKRIGICWANTEVTPWWEDDGDPCPGCPAPADDIEQRDYDENHSFYVLAEQPPTNSPSDPVPEKCPECGAGWIGGYRVHEENCVFGQEEATASPLPGPNPPSEAPRCTCSPGVNDKRQRSVCPVHGGQDG